MSTSNSGDNTLVAAVSGKKIILIAVDLSITTAMSLIWKSNTTALSGAMAFATNGRYALAPNDDGWQETATGEALVLNLSAGTLVAGSITYQEAT